jgi:hypothetical protein
MLASLLGNLLRQARRAPQERALDLATQGWALLEQGDRGEAERCARRALRIWSDCSAAHKLLASLELRGEHYLALIERLHRHLRPATYLEIGVFTGSSLALVRPETEAIGIDPEPRIKQPLHPRTRVFAETSDAFFARRDVRGELGGRPLELAFIDGMHRFEFVLRDFANIERHCSRTATVLVHDCYPLDEATASRDMDTSFWSGDVWRAVVALKKYRPDLRIATVAVPPTGLGVIGGLDPDSRVLSERYGEIVAEMMALPYSALDAGKARMLNLVPGDWPTVLSLLGAPQRNEGP